MNTKSMNEVGKDGMIVLDISKLQKLLSDDIESSTEKDGLIHCLNMTEESIRNYLKDFEGMVDGIAGQGIHQQGRRRN